MLKLSIDQNKRIQHELEMERSRFALAQKYPVANEPSSPVLSSAVPDGIVLDGNLIMLSQLKCFSMTIAVKLSIFALIPPEVYLFS